MSSDPHDDDLVPAPQDEPSLRDEPSPHEATEENDLSSAALSAAFPLSGAFGPAEDEAAGLRSGAETAQPRLAEATTACDRDADDRLIDRSLGGDSAAYGELVRNYQDRLRVALQRLTGSAEEAEDVAQEAFVQAYLKLSGFQRSSRFYTWIYRIAFNLAISKNRKRRPRVSFDAIREAGAAEPTATVACPTDATFQGERAELLHAAIAELEDDHRQVIVLREFEEMDYQQIAEVIDTPIGTVRSRLFRARSQLRERLADLLDETPDDHAT